MFSFESHLNDRTLSEYHLSKQNRLYEKTNDILMNRIIRYSIVLILLLANNGYAQLNPLAAQYFNHPYLANAAFAGVDDGLNLSMSYRKLWNNIPGSPEMQNFSADYGYKKTGIGLNINFDKAGLQRQSRVVGSYAYHLPLNGNKEQLHFGVSLGFMNQRLSNNDINGDVNDPLAMQYNQQETYIDGDFGIAYTSSQFKLEASLPNLNSIFKRSSIKLADVPTFYSSMSYSFELSPQLDGIILEPKLAYRGIKSYDNIMDMGVNLALANKQIMFMAMYHTSKNISLGFGVDYKRKYLISGAYTKQTSTLSSYTNGSFELSLKLHLSN